MISNLNLNRSYLNPKQLGLGLITTISVDQNFIVYNMYLLIIIIAFKKLTEVFLNFLLFDSFKENIL